MYIIETIFLGLIFCLPMIWVARLKTELNIANRKVEQWRTLAINTEFKMKQLLEKLEG